MNDTSPLSDLRRISRQKFDPARMEEFVAELRSTNDRTLAIVWGTLVEDAIQKAIMGKMSHLEKGERKLLYGYLSGFEVKNLLAFGMQIISRQQFADIDIIRELRNAFAHTAPHISFAHETVMRVCDTLSNSSHYFMRTTNRRAIFSYRCLQLWMDIGNVEGGFTMSSGDGYVHFHPAINAEQSP